MFNNVITDEQKVLMNRLGAMPLVTGIYHALQSSIAGGSLLINDFKQTNAGYVLILGTQQGFNLVNVVKADNTYTLRVNNNYTGDCTSDNHLLVKTTNPKYLVRSVMAGTPRQRITDALESAQNHDRYRLNNILSKYKRFARPDQKPLELNDDATTWLLNSFFGTVQSTSAPKDVLAAIEEARSRALSNQAKMDKFISKATEMFDKPKWVVMFRPEVLYSGTPLAEDIIIGAINGKQLYDHMIGEYIGGSGSARYNLPKPEYTMPLTMYRGFENIDPAIRDEIMGKLTMFKVFRSSNNNNTTYQSEHEVGAGGYIPINGFNRCVITEELNFIAEGSMRDGVCMLFDK